MTNKLSIAALLVIPVGAAFASFASVQEKKPAEAAAATDDPALAKMKEFATPGPAHKVLESKVGKWTAKVKIWMEPGKNPETSDGTCESKWILGGRFVEDNFTGIFMGKPFQGRGLTGYDNIKKKYVSSWIDDAATSILYSEGSYDAASKTFTYSGDTPDCMAGKYVKSRTVDKMVDADHWTMQMYSPGPDGKEYMSMEIAYSRAK